MFGNFTKDSKEFLINNPATPRPWINYLCTKSGSYVSLLSANAGGYSYVSCPKDGRITRWRYNSLPEDRPGRYIYLKNTDTNDYWSLSWQPTAKPVKHYNVVHGLGYTKFNCDYANIKAEATYFVPLDDTCEIWQIKLKNTTSQTINLEVFPFAEMTLGHALVDLINKPNDQHFNRLWFDKDTNSIFTTKTYWLTGDSANQQENKEWDHVAFMSSSIESSEFAGERELFIGQYRDEHNPVAIENGALQNKPVSSGNIVSSMKLKLTLEPNQEIKFHITLGASKKSTGKLEEKCIELINKYKTSESVDKAYQEVLSYWNNYCSALNVKTPSEQMNTYLNYWNQYQSKITFINSRNASYYHWGVLRGMGFRDSLQDTIAVVITEPDLVRERILQLAKYQKSDGICAHCFHPVSCEVEFTGHKDDPLWLITATWYYLAETNDDSILHEKISFYDNKDATLLDHLKASVSFIEKNLGENNIPTFGRGDWNDTLDYVCGKDGNGESIWAGMFYAYNLLKFIDISNKYLSDNTYKDYLSSRYDSVKKALNEKAWDGEWYMRAVCSDGKKLGSNTCDEGKIYLNPQTWAVLSGVAEEKSKELLKVTLEKLDTAYGPKLLAPAYHKIDNKIGLITRCVWGKKENASIFNHTTTWLLMALSEIGDADYAMDLYHRLTPISFDQSKYEIEPYVYSQYTTSDEHETFGQGSHAWLTGTATWMFRATTDHILGIKTTLNGIIINPVIPADWKDFEVTRKYRGTTYKIKVVNKNTGSTKITINGTDNHDPKLPLPIIDGQKIVVDVVM